MQKLIFLKCQKSSSLTVFGKYNFRTKYRFQRKKSLSSIFPSYNTVIFISIDPIFIAILSCELKQQWQKALLFKANFLSKLFQGFNFPVTQYLISTVISTGLRGELAF